MTPKKEKKLIYLTKKYSLENINNIIFEMKKSKISDSLQICFYFCSMELFMVDLRVDLWRNRFFGRICHFLLWKSV